MRNNISYIFNGALLFSALIFFIGLIRQVSISVLLFRALLCGVVMCLLLLMLLYFIQRFPEEYRLLFRNNSFGNEKSKITDNQEEQDHYNNLSEQEIVQHDYQIERDIIYQLKQDSARSADLIRKMALSGKDE